MADLTFDERNIYKSLPSRYSDYCKEEYITDSGLLVEYWERVYLYWISQIESLLSVDSDLTKLSDTQLDAFAVFFGFTEDYYDPSWDKDIKICLFSHVYREPYIWKYRGSREVLRQVIKCFGLNIELTRTAGFIAGINKAGDVCGSPANSDYLLVLDNAYQPGTKEYYYVLYIVKTFVPLYANIDFRYKNQTQITRFIDVL